MSAHRHAAGSDPERRPAADPPSTGGADDGGARGRQSPLAKWQRVEESVEDGSVSTSESVRALLVESIGGWRGMVDSGLPVVVFVIANVIGGLTVGIWSAIGCAVLLFAVRLARRESVQQSISGLFAVGVAAFIAWRMGQARGFFLLGIWRNAIYGGLLLISVLVRWPAIGAAWEYLDGRGTAWRRNPRLMRAYSAVTLLWVAVFGARVLVQRIFYVRDETGWLAGSSLAMGYPLMGAALLVTVLVIRRVSKSPKENDAAGKDAEGAPAELAREPGGD